MPKINLTDLNNLQNEATATAAINSNNTLIEAAVENSISRDGTQPNQMNSVLDMNSNRIINLPEATSDQEPVTYGTYIEGITSVANGAVIDGSFITLDSNPTLINERVLTAGPAIEIVDGGPGGNAVIGLSSQELSAIAGAGSEADKFPYYDGIGSVALTDLSSFARTLLDDSDAVTARATLGVSTGSGDLVAANNLSDVANTTTARTNLGAGIGDMLGSNNLSDVADAATARYVIGAASEESTRKNYIINGAMQISQENGTSAGTAAGYYPVDQFRLEFSNSGTQTIQQVASVTPAGSPNRIRLTATVADASVAATDYCMISQKIEGLRVADLRLGSASAKTITVQFGVKAPAGTYSVAFRNSDGTRGFAAEYTISGPEANTDVVKSVTVALDQVGTWLSDKSSGLEVAWILMCGATFQTPAGAWAAGNFLASSNQYNFMGTVSNVFELFDVSLTEGTVAPPFVVPDYAETLRACQRYWENGGFYASAPAGQYANICYKVSKRAAATVTTTLSGTVVVNSTEDHGFHVITSAGISGFSFTADARL